MALLRGSMSPSVMIVCAVVLLTLQCGYVISTLRGINAEVHTAILAVHKQLLQHSKEHVSNEHQISQDLSMHRSEMKELLRAEVSEWQQTKLRQASELQVLELKQKLAEVTAERDTAERHLADAKDNSPTLRTNALRAALHKEQAAHDWTRRDLGSSRDELDTMRETLRAQDLNTTAIRLKSELEAAKARLAAASGKLRQCAQKWNPKDGTGKGECAAATSLFCPEEPAPAQALPFRRDWSDIDEHSNTSKQLAMAPGGGWQAYVPWSSQPSWEDCMILDCVRTPQCHGKDRLGGAHMLLAAIANGDKPCCSDVLLEVMLRFSQFMRAKNVSHFLSYGSLLGSVRSSDLIPWTNDVDLTVPAYAISRIMSPEWQSGLKQVGLLAFRGGAHAKGIARTCLRKDHPTLKKLHADCDTAIHRKFLASKSRETFYIQHFPYGDVYVTHPSPLNPRALYTRALIAHTCTASESSKLGWNCKIPTDMCVEGDSSCIAAYASEYFPLRPCSVQGHQMPCARDPFSFLHRRYGPLWYQPTKNNPTDVALKSHKSELNAISVSQVSAIPSADKLRKAECLVTEWSNWEPCRVRRVNLGAKGRKVSLQACVQHRIRLKLETEYEKHSSKCKLDAVELCQWSDCGSELPPAAATEGDLFTAPRPAATLTPAEMEAAHRDHAKVEQMLHRTAAPTASPVDHDTPKVPSLGVDAAKGHGLVGNTTRASSASPIVGDVNNTRESPSQGTRGNQDTPERKQAQPTDMLADLVHTQEPGKLVERVHIVSRKSKQTEEPIESQQECDGQLDASPVCVGGTVFALVDADSDGAVTKEELHQYLSKTATNSTLESLYDLAELQRRAGEKDEWGRSDFVRGVILPSLLPSPVRPSDGSMAGEDSGTEDERFRS